VLTEGIIAGASPSDEALFSGSYLQHDGSYYLPYYSYPTQDQMDEAYPRNKEFFQLKKQFDPNEVFINLFYKEYSQ